MMTPQEIFEVLGRLKVSIDEMMIAVEKQENPWAHVILVLDPKAGVARSMALAILGEEKVKESDEHAAKTGSAAFITTYAPRAVFQDYLDKASPKDAYYLRDKCANHHALLFMQDDRLCLFGRKGIGKQFS